MDEGGRKSSEKIGAFYQLAKFSSVGLEMGIAVLVGWGVGFWLDKKLGTAPWIMLLCLLLGVGAAFKGLIRTAREASGHGRESKE